jgi:hypothetical protein
LTGRSPAFENVRRKRRFYLSVNVLLGLAIIALGAVLRAIPDVAGR